MMSRMLFFLLFYHFILTSGWSSDSSCSYFGNFQCKDGTCVSFLFRCDQKMDCADGSDEENCENYKGIKCDKTIFFECKNRRCISNFFKCDQEDDCGDNSDEEDCGDKELQGLLHNCTKDEFQCRDKLCIPLADFCNKQQDCLDGTDEYKGCERMLPEIHCSGFKCKNGMCISSHWRCDGINDCLDNSDELSCETAPVSIQECNASIDWYLCNNSRCIPLNLTCNDKNDCGDGSDEGGVCKNATVNCNSNSHKCEQICRNTPRGAFCACRSGFRLENNKCTDIDECNNYGICSQICVNTRGSYYCSCDYGYELSDNKATCKVKGGEALMIFSTKTDIRGYYLDSEVYFYVARNLQHVVGVSQDAKHIYWTNMESGEESIIRSLEDGTNREMIVTAGLGSPEDLEVDWVTGNIYFTDSAYKRIGVCNNDGSYCTVIISEKTEKPKGIVLYPVDGLMYWSDWGDTPHISVAEMDGKGQEFFVTKDLSWPNGLTIDKPNKRLYWVDAKSQRIESIRLDGTDRRIILKDIVKSPYAIDVFEDKLYFSDWALNVIHSCNKFTGKDFKTLFREKEAVYGLHIYHSTLKIKYGNPCLTKPCSQLCLLAANRTYSCACTLDHELTYDKHTCKESLKQGHLLIGAGNQMIDYYHEILGKPKMTASVTLKHVTDLAYDSITDTVFAADQLTNSLFSFNPHSGVVKHILSIQNQYMGGMDFDYIGNNLYWSNTEFNSIEVYSMWTQTKFDIPFQNQPHEIALVPEKGIMYVVFQQKNKEYQIAKMDLTGSSKLEALVIKNNLIGPRIPLAYDFEKQRLYWADEDAGRIDSISQNGDDRKLFRTGLNKPVSLSILGGFVFWTQRGSKQLFWSDKTNAVLVNKAINIRVADNLEVMHLVSLHERSAENHPCTGSQGSLCSHICIVTNTHGYTCECPYGMSLKKDGKTCEQRTCQPDEWKCMRTGHCILRAKRCDGKMDCPGGEDEISCNSTNNHCSFSQFQCENNQCIDIKKYCDSNFDCVDGSDEQNCMKKLCNDDEFHCHDRSKCIFKSLVCNGYNDCSDTSDEIDCSSYICDTNQFRCKSGTCIPIGWVCDTQFDCLDGSDEPENCSSLSCTSMFHCKNGHCLDIMLICDGIDDCGDNSDEEKCVLHQICNENEYKCSGTETCISERFRCNGFADCPKSDDEQNCVQCGLMEFKCDNDKCINLSWVCDQQNDCDDNSDEKSCLTSRQAAVDVANFTSCQEFHCRDGSCLAYNKCCDGVFNCGDLSDENGQCATACSESNLCEHVCMKTPNGPVCRCNAGYRLRDDKKSCEDINECDFNEKVCTHMCINTPGSYKCDCFRGYQLRSNGRSCKSVEGAPMSIITTSNQNIWKISADGNMIKNIISGETDEIRGLDVNVVTNTIYWSIAEQRKISRFNLDSEIREDFQMNEGYPELLSLDWATENIYVFDNLYLEKNKSIKVCNIDQKNCALLISIPEGDHVYSLAVDPVSGFLFWGQARQDFTVSAIYRAEMTGENVTAIISKGLKRISGITVDHVRSRIYWCDKGQQVIEGSNFDGTDRQVVFREGIYHPFHLSLYEDYLYWLESEGRKLHSCSLFLGEPCTEINLGTQHDHNFVAILQKARQPPVENRCKQHNCEHICVLTAESSACLCEDEEFPIKITGTCTSGSSIHHRASERQENSSIWCILLIIFTLIVIAVIIGYANYKYRLWKRFSIFFRSFMNRIGNNGGLQYASHYNNNSNSSGVDISTEIINPTYNERQHQQLQQQQQQRKQNLFQQEQGQQLQPMPTPKKLVKPLEMKPNFFDESPTNQDDICLIPESDAKFKY